MAVISSRLKTSATDGGPTPRAQTFFSTHQFARPSADSRKGTAVIVRVVDLLAPTHVQEKTLAFPELVGDHTKIRDFDQRFWDEVSQIHDPSFAGIIR
jgi:hypothetical protein